MRLIFLVVRVELFVARYHPPVKRMRLLARYLHHNRLLHAVGDHFAHHFLAAALNFFCSCCFRHYFFSVAAERARPPVRSPMIVLTRAMSLRSPRIFFRLSV